MSTEEAHREAQRRDQEMIEAEGLGQRVASWNSRRKSSHGVSAHPLPEGVSRRSREGRRSDMDENYIPERVLTTAPMMDTRDSTHEPVLPVVQEIGELSREDSEFRPETPPKDKALPPTRAPPPTPPKPSHLKPMSQDSGYGGNGMHENGPKLRHRVSRESLDKELPPLPNKEGSGTGGIRMVA